MKLWLGAAATKMTPPKAENNIEIGNKSVERTHCLLASLLKKDVSQ